jgi:hypothetical protein
VTANAARYTSSDELTQLCFHFLFRISEQEPVASGINHLSIPGHSSFWSPSWESVPTEVPSGISSDPKTNSFTSHKNNTMSKSASDGVKKAAIEEDDEPDEW